MAALFAATALSATAACAAQASDLSYNSRYAAIVVDAQSGEVLYAARADSARYPASLTKIMTLYMVFDALAKGDIRPSDTITVSARAASQAPVKVYLKAGDTIDVDTAMRLAAMYSANDMAEALAEKVGGTEERFAAMMTIKAKELGMTQTNFVNANGLPDPRQLSSARDLAILARAVMRDFPQYYSYFDLPTVTYRGRTYYNHNPLHGMPGVDGMKTGYTNAAGQNLVASQVKNNHRLVAVMLGAADKQQRREHVTELLSIGFDVMDRREHGEVIAIAQNEFARQLDMPSMSTNAVQYASNDRQFSDQELRDTLEGSEQANAQDVDVQKASAQVKAPLVVQTLTQSPQAQAAALATPSQDIPDTATPAAPVPYAAVKAAIQPPAYQPVKAVVVATVEADAKPAAAKASAKPVNKSEANLAAAVETNRKGMTAQKTTKADDRKQLASRDDSDDDSDAPVKCKKGKKCKKEKEPGWSIQVGAFKEKSLASDWVRSVKMRFDDALAESRSEISKNDNGWYRTRFAALTKEQATKACKSMEAKRLDCMVIKPDA
ncbi:serine hydrolase [Asticcacaulis solisilvae]|uniref:serine hydrolase n=1 Tax=Asticcacaulis solisilvae TaxID=1217274 RepID=UPI003FD8A04F